MFDMKSAILKLYKNNLIIYFFSVRENNFPPLPSWFPIKPCFYQDITLEIPSEFQKMVKMVYYTWIGELNIRITLNTSSIMNPFCVTDDNHVLRLCFRLHIAVVSQRCGSACSVCRRPTIWQDIRNCHPISLRV